MGDNTGNNLVGQITQTLKADPKKTGLLTLLVAVLAAVVGKAVLTNGKSLPASARATQTLSAKSQSQSQSSAPRSPLSAKQSAALSELQKWSSGAVPPVSRNLFAVRMEYFPVDGSRTTQSGPNEDGFWAKLEKSMALQADQKDKRENLIANFTAQAKKLNLQSIMMGPQPRAMVNGEIVGEGSVVAEFRVLKIEARRIIVEREGITLQIQMK